MKIALVFDGLGFGGIERIGLDYSKIALDLGYDVDIYNLNPKADALVSTINKKIGYYPIKYSRILCPELYSYGIQKYVWGKYAYAILSPILSLVQTIYKVFKKKKSYDVAISIAGHINDLSFVGKSFIKSKKKVVWCHGKLLSYLAICDAYPILYKKVDTIVTLSSVGEKEVYLGKKFLYDKNIQKIYNPSFIKEEKINYEYVNELKSKYGDFILMIARFKKGKGQDIAIEVLKRIHEAGIKKYIVFLGDGDTIDTCKEMAKKYGLEKYCIFEGSKKNVCDYIMASYINLLTSQWEGLPTVIIEAMSLGKPCVMTNSDDGEVSDNGKYCILTKVDDIDSIYKRIINLYNNHDLYREYCELSLERAKDFDPIIIKKQFKKLIEE